MIHNIVKHFVVLLTLLKRVGYVNKIKQNIINSIVVYWYSKNNP